MPRQTNSKGKRPDSKTKVEKDRQAQAEITDIVQGQLLDELRTNPEFIHDLPPHVKASFLQSRMPKAQPLSEDVQQNALSLSASIEQLPNLDDLTARCAALATELRYALQIVESEKWMIAQLRAKLKDRTPFKFGEITRLLWRVQAAVVSYYEEKRVSCLTQEEIDAWVKDAFDKAGMPMPKGGNDAADE